MRGYSWSKRETLLQSGKLNVRKEKVLYILDKQRNHDRWYVNHINFQTIYGGNSYLMCKLSDLVINICLLHFFYLTLSKFLSLRHVSMPYFQFWRPCLLLPCKKRGDWFTGKPDVGLNYQIFLTLRDEYCL